MSPSLAPGSLSAAITSVYIVIASCTPWIVVSRSATICEIDTFMTLLSSTITNCALARMASGAQLTATAPFADRTALSEALIHPQARRRGASRQGRAHHLDNG